MSTYIKKNGVYVPATKLYYKLNGAWSEVAEAPVISYTQLLPCFYKGDAPTTKYVTNLLPQYTIDNWDLTRFNGGNYNYSPSNYSGESVKPQGNIMVVFPDGTYSECYTTPKPAYYPYLAVGHTYYLRWYSRKELITNSTGGNGSSNNSGVSEDVYWPEMEYALIRGLNESSYNLWRKNTAVFTLQQSQWPNNTVTDGYYKIRFDLNNNRKYVKYWCTADYMLIDLTACYTNQGYSVPSKSQLDAKPYFYGSLDIESW